MIVLADARAAIAKALTDAGLNVSRGDDLVPLGASIGAFTIDYHPTFAGNGVKSMGVAALDVRVMTDRADEASAFARVDEAMNVVPPLLEAAPGPWRSLTVQVARNDSPVTVGDASYAVVTFSLALYV